MNLLSKLTFSRLEKFLFVAAIVSLVAGITATFTHELAAALNLWLDAGFAFLRSLWEIFAAKLRENIFIGCAILSASVFGIVAWRLRHIS